MYTQSWCMENKKKRNSTCPKKYPKSKILYVPYHEFMLLTIPELFFLYLSVFLRCVTNTAALLESDWYFLWIYEQLCILYVCTFRNKLLEHILGLYIHLHALLTASSYVIVYFLHHLNRVMLYRKVARRAFPT